MGGKQRPGIHQWEASRGPGFTWRVVLRGPDCTAGSVCPFFYSMLVYSDFHRGNCDKAAFGERFEFRTEN